VNNTNIFNLFVGNKHETYIRTNKCTEKQHIFNPNALELCDITCIHTPLLPSCPVRAFEVIIIQTTFPLFTDRNLLPAGIRAGSVSKSKKINSLIKMFLSQQQMCHIAMMCGTVQNHVLHTICLSPQWPGMFVSFTSVMTRTTYCTCSD